MVRKTLRAGLLSSALAAVALLPAAAVMTVASVDAAYAKGGNGGGTGGGNGNGGGGGNGRGAEARGSDDTAARGGGRPSWAGNGGTGGKANRSGG